MMPIELEITFFITRYIRHTFGHIWFVVSNIFDFAQEDDTRSILDPGREPVRLAAAVKRKAAESHGDESCYIEVDDGKIIRDNKEIQYYLVISSFIMQYLAISSYIWAYLIISSRKSSHRCQQITMMVDNFLDTTVCKFGTRVSNNLCEDFSIIAITQLYQWISLRENLQETPIINGKNHGFLQIFP